MKHIINSVVLMIVMVQSHAQFSHGSIPLTIEKKLKHIDSVPFDQIIVLDNRFDSTNFLIAEVILKKPEMDGFSLPASKEIRKYLEKAIAPFSKEKGTVYINLKQLRFGNLRSISGTLFFAADVYLVKEEKLIKIFSAKKEYSFHRTYNRTITLALNNLIEEVSKNYYLQNKTPLDTFTLEEVNKNVREDWGSYAIIKQNNYEDGIYKTLNDFKDNKVDSSLVFKMQFEPDSFYHIIFFKKNKYVGANGLVENVYAVSYEGDLYLLLLGKYFLPLHKKDNSFHFYVPQSLADMYTMICIGMFPSGNSGGGFQPDFSSANVNSLAGFLVVLGAIIVVGITVEIINVIRDAKRSAVGSNHKTTYQRVKIGGMRNCFLDMDTGDVIYH